MLFGRLTKPVKFNKSYIKHKMSDSIFNKYALTKFNQLACEVLKKTDSGKLPENMVELMYQAMSEKVEPIQRVSVRDILCSDIPLPFMPDLIDYKIGQGCCDAIMKRDGLFTPCSNHCAEGNKCAKHTKEYGVFQCNVLGDYKARYAAWEKKQPYVVDNPGATFTEKHYGAYLHTKKLDSTAVKEELAKWGIQLEMDPSLFKNPNRPVRTTRGRKSEKKVTDTDEPKSDDGDGLFFETESEPDEPSDSDEAKATRKKEPKAEAEDEPKAKAEKPKPKPRRKKEEPKEEPKAEDSDEPNSEEPKEEPKFEKPSSRRKKAEAEDEPKAEDSDEPKEEPKFEKPSARRKKAEAEEPKAEEPKTKPKARSKKTIGTPLDGAPGELAKEQMEKQEE